VAGIAAGAGAAGGFDGVAKGAGVVAVQVFSLFPNYYGANQGEVLSYSSDQIRGLERVYALVKQVVNPLKIAAVNMSLGGGKYSRTCDVYYGATKSAIDNLRSVGVATVIAAGNDGWKTSISGPACISTAISVGATCDEAGGNWCATGVDDVAGYSNIASFVSLVAPGSYITSSVPGTGYATWSGTSMATPHVAGAWAVLKDAQPNLSVPDALAQFRANAVTVGDTRPGGSVTGLKRVDLAFVGSAPLSPKLTVQIIKSGAKANGSVTSSPAGISCGSTCIASFAKDSTVKLTAKATGGSKFGGWGGACSAFTTTTTCTLTMTGNLDVTARFTK
jgi:subtilisin family serine protease